jgi:hypothetical protein
MWFSYLLFYFLCSARCDDILEDEIASLDELIRLQVNCILSISCLTKCSK